MCVFFIFTNVPEECILISNIAEPTQRLCGSLGLRGANFECSRTSEAAKNAYSKPIEDRSMEILGHLIKLDSFLFKQNKW